jgi:signal peptidase II
MTDDATPTAPTDEAPPQEPVGDDGGAPHTADHAGDPHLPIHGDTVPNETAGEASTEAPSPEPSTLAAAPAAAAPWRPNYLFLAGLALVSLAIDLATKQWAKVRLDGAKSFADRRIEVIHDHVRFSFAENRGGAWGLLQDEPESVRRPFFLGISLVAVVFIVSLYRKLAPQQWALRWGLPLVLGGALGNLVNRIQYNFVIDFVDVSARWGGHEHHWPTFNVADIAIVVGVGLMAIDMFTPAKRAATPPPSRPIEAPVPAAAEPEPAPKES